MLLNISMGLEKSSDAISSTVFDRHVKDEEEKWNNIMSMRRY